MKINYIQHSGFAVEYKDVLLVFDYYKGSLPEFEPGKPVFVFVSHAHFDHFNRKIFLWVDKYPGITYILSDDIIVEGTKGCVVMIGPDEEKDLGRIRIKTLGSTDEGVAFLVFMDGCVIFHAGDLNWWHWEDEGEVYNQFMEKNYLSIIHKIEGQKIDAAFFPVDPRLEDACFLGLHRFMTVTETRRVFPMHMQGQYGLYDKLMQEPQTERYRDQIMQIKGPGQVFEIDD